MEDGKVFDQSGDDGQLLLSCVRCGLETGFLVELLRVKVVFVGDHSLRNERLEFLNALENHVGDRKVLVDEVPPSFVYARERQVDMIARQ